MADFAKTERADTGASGTRRLRTCSAVRLFALLGIGLGLPLAAIMLLSAVLRPGGVVLPLDLIVAVAVGTTVTVPLGLLHYYRSRSVAKGAGFALAALEVPDGSQVLEVIVRADITRATEMATRALRRLNSARPVTVVEPGKLQIVTSMGWSSWGNGSRSWWPGWTVSDRRCACRVSGASGVQIWTHGP